MKQNTIVVVYGKKGQGKSTLLERLVSGRQNVIVFDALGSYVQMPRGEFSSRLPGFMRLSNTERAAEIIHTTPLGEFRPKPFRLVLSPRAGDLEAQLAEVVGAIRQRYRKVPEHTHIMVDEADLFNRGYRSSIVIEEMVKRGRHFLLNQLYATRRPAELPRLVSSQADDFYVLKITEERDLQHLWNYFPKVLVKEFKQFQVGEYMHLDTRKDTIGRYRP